MKKCSPSTAMKETQVKVTLRRHLAPGRMAVTNDAKNNQCWRGHGEKELSYTADEM
jgi:hypothetical protein